jgi:hypothetical protein
MRCASRPCRRTTRSQRYPTSFTFPTKSHQLWTIDAMQSDNRWAKSRQLATDALEALGRTPGQPAFDGASWIRGSE